MINSYDDLKDITQEFYVITYRAELEGITRLCYLMHRNKPLFFFKHEDAKSYFETYEVDTVNDGWFPWKKGKLFYPDAKIVRATLSNFEVVE